METTELLQLAKVRFGELEGVALDRASVAVNPNFGRIMVVPPEEHPVSTVEELAQGATIAHISIEYSSPPKFLQEGSPPKFLQDGIYSVRVFRDYGTWVAEFIQKDEVVLSTLHLEVIPISEKQMKPWAIILTGPSVARVIPWAFFFGFVLGVIVGAGYVVYIYNR